MDLTLGKKLWEMVVHICANGVRSRGHEYHPERITRAQTCAFDLLFFVDQISGQQWDVCMFQTVSQ